MDRTHTTLWLIKQIEKGKNQLFRSQKRVEHYTAYSTVQHYPFCNYKSIKNSLKKSLKSLSATAKQGICTIKSDV